MVVCGHGEVAGFCSAHEMEILESYDGPLSEYKGNCAVIVTAAEMSREEYDSLKCNLFSRGVELVSTAWTDDSVILRLLRNQIEQRKKRGGRQMFGYRKRNGVVVAIPAGVAVARRIIELRDSGYTLRCIQEDEGVRHWDGKKLCISTIQTILKNREVYERG